MNTSCDLLVAGGGIMGLWTAKFAADAGLRAILVDKGRIGGGGSNGLLGALLPHLPSAANDRKRFQWQALAELPQLIAEIEAATGLATGYRQCGRLMPVRLPGFGKRLQPCLKEAPQHWQFAARSHRFELVEAAPFGDWLAPETAPLGCAFDDLSARAQPRRLTAALQAALTPAVPMIEGFAFARFDERAGRVLARDGRAILARSVVLAAGYETYPVIDALLGGDFGRGIKGHSALFRVDGADEQPIIYSDGVYVVPHDDGHVAAGSTAEEDWHDAAAIERQACENFIDRARALCPRLRGVEPVDYWAGVRPRSHAKEPICGRLEDGGELYVLTGGYKISFGIAHRLARALIERLLGRADAIPLPASYEVGYHVAEAERDSRLHHPTERNR